MKPIMAFMPLHTTEIANGVSVDIGGGSTEVTLFKNKELVESHSFPFGVVTLTRMFLKIKRTTTNQLLKIWKIHLFTI